MIINILSLWFVPTGDRRLAGWFQAAFSRAVTFDYKPGTFTSLVSIPNILLLIQFATPVFLSIKANVSQKKKKKKITIIS